MQVVLGFVLMITCKECGVEFPKPPGKGGHFRKYCDEHFVGETSGSTMKVGRPCKKCGGAIGVNRSKSAKYCSTTCRKKYQDIIIKERNTAKRKAIERETNRVQNVGTGRRGTFYDAIMNDPILKNGLLTREIPLRVAAQKLGTTEATISRSVMEIRSDIEFSELTSNWEPSWRVRAMLPRHKVARIRELGLAHDLTDEFHQLADELVKAYSVFSRYYFNLEGKRPLVEGFHEKWIRSIIVAYATGGKQLILSPPRHGKSEMLIRFVVWFIVMDPNIRIGWFCASTDVAKLMLGAVKDILENNQVLIDDTLPPGQLYDPGLKSSKVWSAKEIKVAQQTHIGAKSSSMLALGRTSKFLSRDMDIIIIDDMEDYDSTREEGQRVYSKNKLAEIGTRKVEETAEVYIGSRQHPDDIPNAILDLGDTILQWKVIVDSAHDENCGEDPDDFDAHWDCMLFPAVRSYRYLMEKKLEMETLGLGHLYPLRYLNTAVPEDGQVFDMPAIRENLNKERGIGLGELPPGYLVGGLDPSARGIQASFLWHYRKDANHGPRVSMVDILEDQSGGVQGAVDVIIDWYHKYDLRLWYYEVNSQQIEFYKIVKERVAKVMMKELGHNPIAIKEHSTGKNKQDAELGISTLAPLYENGTIDLPYGTNEARRKTNSLLRQLELWTTDGVKNRKAKTDIKMAMWFPFVGKIWSFIREHKIPNLHISNESSYPDEGHDESPWASQYPGGW